MDSSKFRHHLRRLLLRLVAALIPISIASFLVSALFVANSAPNTGTRAIVLTVILLVIWSPVVYLVIVIVSEQPFSISPGGISPLHRPLGYLIRGKTTIPLEELSRIRVDSEAGEMFAKILAADGTLVEVQESQGIPRRAFTQLQLLSDALQSRKRDKGDARAGTPTNSE